MIFVWYELLVSHLPGYFLRGFSPFYIFLGVGVRTLPFEQFQFSGWRVPGLPREVPSRLTAAETRVYSGSPCPCHSPMRSTRELEF